MVKNLPVSFGDHCHVLGTPHAALYLKSSYPRPGQSGQRINETKVGWAQPILAPVIGFNWAAVTAQMVRQPAGLGTPPPVAAPPPDQAAHQTLTGITETERSVHENLQLCPRDRIMDCIDFTG